MSHEVETMAYTNEVPWHRLGVHVADAPDVEEMIQVAGLDWTVEKRPMVAATSYNEKTHKHTFDLEVPDFYALVRSSDDKVLDVVGSRYTPVQNTEAFEFFKEFVEAGDATMETAGSLRGGRLVWGLADLNASFRLPGKDEVKGYLLIAAPHEQGKSLIIRLTNIRVVCNNTLTLALREKGSASEFRMPHLQSFDANVIQRAKETLGIAREQLREFERNARLLKKLKVTTGDVTRICAELFTDATPEDVEDMVTDPDSNATPRIKSILSAYTQAPGADPGTGWGALNAVTYWADHIASRTQDQRLANAWFGKTAVQKEKVLNTLLEMAA